MNQQELLDYYWHHTKKELNPYTRLVLWPESALTDMGWVENLNEFSMITQIRDSILAYSNADLVTGGIIYELYAQGNPSDKPATVAYSSQFDQSYYTYTMALQIAAHAGTLSMRTKKKLVPFEETIPYPKLLSGFHNLIGTLGGLFLHLENGMLN